MLEYLIWFLFVLVAVTDAREQRIPNRYLLAILAISLVQYFLSDDVIHYTSMALIGLVVMFAASLVFHLVGAMAPGDVKLLGVVGFVAGWGELLSVSMWVAVATVIVGGTFMVYRSANSDTSFKQILLTYKTAVLYGTKSARLTLDSSSQNQHMPFAPVVVIGLAMQSYYAT